jgi:hypothetical protein
VNNQDASRRKFVKKDGVRSAGDTDARRGTVLSLKPVSHIRTKTAQTQRAATATSAAAGKMPSPFDCSGQQRISNSDSSVGLSLSHCHPIACFRFISFHRSTRRDARVAGKKRGVYRAPGRLSILHSDPRRKVADGTHCSADGSVRCIGWILVLASAATYN